MPRIAGITPAGIVFHVINRGNARGDIFGKEEDFAAFENILAEPRTTARRASIAAR
jgi:hypothetical protein